MIGKVLDVGCVHGSIIPALVDAGLSEPDSGGVCGVNLSSEIQSGMVLREMVKHSHA